VLGWLMQGYLSDAQFAAANACAAILFARSSQKA
jgi:hypothetical protein